MIMIVYKRLPRGDFRVQWSDKDRQRHYELIKQGFRIHHDDGEITYYIHTSHPERTEQIVHNAD